MGFRLIQNFGVLALAGVFVQRFGRNLKMGKAKIGRLRGCWCSGLDVT